MNKKASIFILTVLISGCAAPRGSLYDTPDFKAVVKEYDTNGVSIYCTVRTHSPTVGIWQNLSIVGLNKGKSLPYTVINQSENMMSISITKTSDRYFIYPITIRRNVQTTNYYATIQVYISQSDTDSKIKILLNLKDTPLERSISLDQ